MEFPTNGKEGEWLAYRIWSINHLPEWQGHGKEEEALRQNASKESNILSLKTILSCSPTVTIYFFLSMESLLSSAARIRGELPTVQASISTTVKKSLSLTTACKMLASRVSVCSESTLSCWNLLCESPVQDYRFDVTTKFQQIWTLIPSRLSLFFKRRMVWTPYNSVNLR